MHTKHLAFLAVMASFAGAQELKDFGGVLLLRARQHAPKPGGAQD